MKINEASNPTSWSLPIPPIPFILYYTMLCKEIKREMESLSFYSSRPLSLALSFSPSAYFVSTIFMHLRKGKAHTLSPNPLLTLPPHPASQTRKIRETRRLLYLVRHRMVLVYTVLWVCRYCIVSSGSSGSSVSIVLRREGMCIRRWDEVRWWDGYLSQFTFYFLEHDWLLRSLWVGFLFGER